MGTTPPPPQQVPKATSQFPDRKPRGKRKDFPSPQGTLATVSESQKLG